MAPNLLVKAAFVRGDYDSSGRLCADKLIRTEFILQNMYSYLISSVVTIQPMPAANSKEEKIINVIKRLVDEFKQNYNGVVQRLCSDLEFTTDTLGSVLQGVANELFCEGISWSRIVALFAFVGELTVHCLANNVSENIVDDMYECFRRLVEEDLMKWVEDHHGWEGVQCLSKKADSNQDLNGSSSDKGWAKSILHNTVRMFGTLAHFANTGGQSFP